MNAVSKNGWRGFLFAKVQDRIACYNKENCWKKSLPYAILAIRVKTN